MSSTKNFLVSVLDHDLNSHFVPAIPPSCNLFVFCHLNLSLANLFH